MDEHCCVELGGDLSFTVTEGFIREVFTALQIGDKQQCDLAVHCFLKEFQCGEAPYLKFREFSKEFLHDRWDDAINQAFDAVVAFKAARGSVVILFYGIGFACGATVPVEVADALGVPNLVKTSIISLVLDEPIIVDNVRDFKKSCSLMTQKLEEDLSKAGKNGKSVIVEGPYLDPQLHYEELVMHSHPFPVAVIKCLVVGAVREAEILKASSRWTKNGLSEAAQYVGKAGASFCTIGLKDGDLNSETLSKIHPLILNQIVQKGNKILREEAGINKL